MIKLLSWAGTLASIIGAYSVALGYFSLGYITFLIGAVSWLLVGAYRKDYPLVALNVAFLCANIIGIYRFVIL